MATATQNREDPRPGDEVLEENVSDKTQFATDAPAGAALISQVMDRREGAASYRAMQSIMDWDNSRLAVKPGITGWWQVTERNSTGFDGMVRRDLEYIARRGLLTDLRIIALTIIEVITGKGAC